MEVLSSFNYDPVNLENEIATLESGMGIKTEADRLLEARLLVDHHFVVGSLLTDSPLPIERMFGDQKWAGYLQARLVTRNTDDFDYKGLRFLMDQLHICLMGDAFAGKVDLFRDLDGGRGGQSMYGEFMPLDLTDEQVHGLRQREASSFLRLRHLGGISFESADHPKRGYIKYPDMEYEGEIQDMLFFLFGVSYEVAQNGSPYDEAAYLQQTFIELHPYTDMNGRLSRILMNWRLENAGLPPSILEDFDADVFSTHLQWRAQVQAGSERYAQMQQLIEAGVINPIDLLGLGDLKRFHDELYVPSEGITRPVYEPGALHSHLLTKRYLADVEGQAAWYLEIRTRE